MEKEQKQELGWRVSVLPIPAFHHCEPLHLKIKNDIYWRVVESCVIAKALSNA